MRSILSRAGLGLVSVLSCGAGAASLSHNMSSSDVDDAIEILGFGAEHKAWTAPAVPNDDLGLDLGVESTFLFRRNLEDQGDATGVIPNLIPVPRIWGAWDLPRNFQVSASMAPGFLFDGVTSVGTALQWTYLPRNDYDVSASWLFDYTYVDAFGDLSVSVFGASAQVSRNLDTWQPYAGLGLLLAEGGVRDAIVAHASDSSGHFRFATHFYAGARIDLMAKLSFQLDFVNTQFNFGALMSTSF